MQSCSQFRSQPLDMNARRDRQIRSGVYPVLGHCSQKMDQSTALTYAANQERAVEPHAGHQESGSP